MERSELRKKSNFFDFALLCLLWFSQFYLWSMGLENSEHVLEISFDLKLSQILRFFCFEVLTQFGGLGCQMGRNERTAVEGVSQFRHIAFKSKILSFCLGRHSFRWEMQQPMMHIRFRWQESRRSYFVLAVSWGGGSQVVLHFAWERLSWLGVVACCLHSNLKFRYN